MAGKMRPTFLHYEPQMKVEPAVLSVPPSKRECWTSTAPEVVGDGLLLVTMPRLFARIHL